MGGRIELGRWGACIALPGVLLATTAEAPPAGNAPHAPAPTARPLPAAASGPAVFECSHARELPRTRVETSFRTEWLVSDLNGADTAQSPLEDAQTVFSVAPLAREHTGLAAEITMHRQYSAAREKDKPSKSSKSGPFDMEKPFVIERHGQSWCFAERKPCPSRDKNERLFLAAVGGSVELLVPEPGISAALDGKLSDGTLSIPLSPALLKRVDLSTKRTLNARQHEAGFPALFGYETHDDQAVLASAGNTGKPGARSGELQLEVALERDCRVSGLSVTQDVTVHFAPSNPSAARFHHTRTLTLHFDD